MKRILMFAGWSFYLTAIADAETVNVEQPMFPREYVVVCDMYGTNFYYMPGTETCVNAITGETRRETDSGTEFGQTELAKRVKFLEEALKSLLSEK